MTQAEVESKLDSINRERIAIQKAAYATSFKGKRFDLLAEASAKQAEWDRVYLLWIPPHARND